MEAMIVLTTTDSDELARRIASVLVESRAAACVSIISGIRSLYRWEGKICDDAEQLLLIKTCKDRFEEVRSLIRKTHSYQVPEVVAVAVAAGDSEYLNWLAAQVSTIGFSSVEDVFPEKPGSPPSDLPDPSTH